MRVSTCSSLIFPVGMQERGNLGGSTKFDPWLIPEVLTDRVMTVRPTALLGQGTAILSQKTKHKESVLHDIIVEALCITVTPLALVDEEAAHALAEIKEPERPGTVRRRS
jgi:hypothetical protein